MRDHQPTEITEFNGLWARGDQESCPLDHFSDCENIAFIQSGFRTRDGIDVYNFAGTGVNLQNVVRIYTFVHNNLEGLLVLDILGNIYHTQSPTPTSPILSIPAMTDFAFTGIAGRAYINPNDGTNGLKNQFIYVYLGDGTLARTAGGKAPVGSPMVVVQGAAGNVEKGIHIFAVVYETNTGFLTKLGPVDNFTAYTAVADGFAANVSNIPISPDGFVIARHLVATKLIQPSDYLGDTKGYQFFFIPTGKINDNTTTTLSVSFFDSDLLDDASHLLDIFEAIPAGVGLNQFHGRMLSWTEYGAFNADPTLNTLGNNSLIRVSAPGEPEAFDTVSGLILAPIDGLPLTNAQEYRDVLYCFKQVRTYAYVDNGGDPSSWPLTIIDQGIGASVHGIATVLDSGGVNADYLFMIDYSGVMLFNGSYIRPELSWKIKDYWFNLQRDDFKNIQIYNDSLSQIVYITLPNSMMLIGDYSNNLDFKSIRWAKWKFDVQTTTITLINTNTLIIGSKAQLV